MVTQGVDRRPRLRQATRASHDRLDALIDQGGWLDGASRYQNYLQASWCARAPIERALEGFGIARFYPLWPERRVSDDLHQDIFDLSGALPAQALEALPEPADIAAALGWLYVIEGSALGARLLQARVAGIGMTAEHGARHMARQTACPKAWPMFIKLLAETLLDAPAEDRCIAAAIGAFGIYEHAFRQLAASPMSRIA